MKTAFVLFGAVLLSFSAYAASSQGKVVASKDGVAITEADIRHYIEDRAEAVGGREKVLAQRDIVNKSVENIFLIRYFAEKARQEKLDENEKWQQQLFIDRVLMDFYLKKLLADKKKDMNIEASAKEYYIAHPDKFTNPRLIRAQHILLDKDKKNAADLMAEIIKRHRAGEKFEDLAVEFSDDPSVKKNKGDLGFFAQGKMVPEFDRAAFSLTETGQLSKPIETEFGTHLIRLVSDNGGGDLKPFEVVKEGIMEQLVGDELDSFRKSMITEARSGIKFDHKTVEKILESL